MMLRPASGNIPANAALANEPLRRVGARPSLMGGTSSSVRSIWDYRQLLLLLVRRELKVKYKDSLLGFLWTLVRPLTLLLVYYVAIGTFLGASRSIPDFAIFVFAGLTVWFLFTEVVSGSTASIVANSGLVKKVYLPREVFPLSIVGSSLVNFVVQLLILLLAVILVGWNPLATDLLLFFPLSLLVTLLLSVGVGLVTAATNVYLRDVQYLVDIVLMVLFWASPIVYSYNLVETKLPPGTFLGELYLANPITLAVLGFQRVFWSAAPAGAFPDHLALRLGLAALVCLLLLWFGQRVFARLEGNFAQEL